MDNTMRLAPCGLDCDACAQKPEHCDGCQAEGGRLWCADCAIRTCCKIERGLNNCSECGSFPCRIVLDFEADGWAHHAAAIANLRRLSAGEEAHDE